MPPVTRSTAIVGRRAELAVARAMVDALDRGRGGALLVTGEAGIGKSRLLAEAAARSAERGRPVLRGYAVPGGGTYRPIAEALARPLRELPLGGSARLRPFRAVLERVVPGWADPRGDAAGAAAAAQGPVSDPAVVLGEGLLALLGEIGGPCVLLIEDLHWADAETLGVLAYLADAAPAAPLLLALSARDEVAVPGLTVLAGRPAVTVLGLERLDAAEVGALAATCRGGEPLADAELHRLVERSEGLPFLVEELLDPGGAAVPPTLAGLVAGRLTALPAAGRSVVTAAAVAGADLDWRLLAAVTAQSEDAVLAALRAAADAGLLAVDTTEGVARLRWRHALTRDAVLANLLPPEHAALAARAARVLDERGEPGDRAAAAQLYGVAGERDRAVAVLLALARQDIARGALHSADELLAAADRTGRAPGAVAAERVRVLTLLGRSADALEAGSAALRTGQVRGDEHAEVCLRLARAAIAGGRWPEARSWLERAGRPADPRTLVLGADAAYGAGDVGRAAALARAAVEAVDSEDATSAGPEHAATLCEALMVLARSGTGPDLSGTTALYGRAAQVAAEHALTPWRVEALFGLGSIQYSSGDPTAPALVEARRLALQHGMLARAVQAELLLADAAMCVEGPRAAIPRALRVAEQAGTLRLSGLQAMIEIVCAAGTAWLGDTAMMDALLAAAATRADAPAEVAALEPMVRGIPHLLAHDLRAACTMFDRGFERLLPHESAAPIPYFGLWAVLRTVVGDRDAELRAVLRHHHCAAALMNRVALDYADAVAAGRAGDGTRAAELFTAADAALAATPWWNRVLRLVVLEAAVADGWGDPVPALRADLAAHELAGDEAMARTCRDLLRAAGAPTRRGRGAGPVPPRLRSLGITSREADVLALVAEGRTNAQIAAHLFLSPRTVETHVARLLAKTGAGGRAELRDWVRGP